MARSSLAYVRGFCLKFFFQPIYTDYANLEYFDKRSHLNLLLWNRWTKLNQTCRDGPWVGPFQNGVRQPRLPFKMAAVTKNRNFFKWPKLLYFKPECAQIWTVVHNDELFNMYYRIFYELWTVANFYRLCKLEKRGMKFFKNLLLWNYWANLNQTLLKWFMGGPLPKLCPAFQNIDQDGCHSRT